MMRLGGGAIHCPNGRYQMRKYQGKNPVYTELGNDPTEALNRFRAEETKVKARAAAIAAGLEVVSANDTLSVFPQSN